MNLIGNINAIPFRRFRGGGGVSPIPPFPSISGITARYSALGLTNEQMAANPVWVDKTGNGHDLQMKNFAWKEGSGISDVYLGALVFDGVDDYGVCENFPILTKEKGYTVVALRQWITRGEGTLGLISNVKIWFRDGAFVLEFRDTIVNRSNNPISFGAVGSEMDLPHILTYQTSKSYNGVSITTGSFKGTDVLHVGKLAMTGFGGNYANAAIWELVFLDHDATEEELTKIKDYFVKTYPWFSPTKHGLSPAKPTRTKIVLLLPTLRAMAMILYCLILVLQKGVATMKKGNMLAIWLLMGWMIG